MKYLILGAGPAGLAFANRLKQCGISDFLVLEKEACAGGLCRSVEVDGAPFDIGGGHFLDVRRPKVNRFLFDFMPEEEWNLYQRDSRIFLNGKFISHPIEANIWQFSTDEQIDYLQSIAKAGCNCGKDMPLDFIAWIYWKLGSRIAEDYMLPYNQKMFGDQLNQLGTYWLEKLPNVSFEETLRSCLVKHAYGTQPGHAQFYYPKHYGYGELWYRMANAIDGHILFNKNVNQIDFTKHCIITDDGEQYSAEVIVTTIPWLEFTNMIGMPESIQNSIKELKHTAIQTEYFSENIDTKAHWIYYPEMELPYHRILIRHNFCESQGYWTETNAMRLNMKHKKGIVQYMNHYAYPLNTVQKPQIMQTLLTWCEKQNVYGLGRWGEHEHLNSDLTVEHAINLAEQFCHSLF